MTEDELAEAQAEIQDLREEVREALAEDLGDDPEDYNADRVDEPVPDGGRD